MIRLIEDGAVELPSLQKNHEDIHLNANYFLKIKYLLSLQVTNPKIVTYSPWLVICFSLLISILFIVNVNQ